MSVDVEMLVGQKYTAIRQAAQAFLARSPPNAFTQATGWYGHAAWEVRMFAVLLLGGLAARNRRALTFLYERCDDDPAWQVNEGLAMAFDDYCALVGYAQAIPTIMMWLHAPRPNVRRAVSEGLRPWTAKKRAPFAADPQLAIELLGILKDDESRYVQESVGNALRDISRKHAAPVLAALQEWIAEKPASRPRRTIARFALENAVKADASLRAIYEKPAST